jgi:hypothetical protein
MPDRDDIHGGGGGGSLEDGDDYAEIDPTSIVVAFAITIALFPAIAANVVDPLLNQRTTLRDVLRLYRGLLLSAMIAVPVWVQLFADSGDRGGGGGGGGGGASSQRRGGQQRPAEFAALLCAIGVSWSTVVSAALGPPRYRLVRNPPGGSSSTGGGGDDRAAPPPHSSSSSSSSSSGVGAAGGVGQPPPSTRRRVRGYVE